MKEQQLVDPPGYVGELAQLFARLRDDILLVKPWEGFAEERFNGVGVVPVDLSPKMVGFWAKLDTSCRCLAEPVCSRLFKNNHEETIELLGADVECSLTAGLVDGPKIPRHFGDLTP